MLKKLQKTDYIFACVLICGFFIHIAFTLIPHFLYDETFYATIPYRLVMGDSLVQDEWHLSQFSSFFSYLPVKIWMAIKGSSEGIILYLRYVYLSVHTFIAAIIYHFFKKYKNWAIVAAMMFFMQIPYKIYAISYNSMFAIFLLLFTFCLVSIYNNNTKKTYILAGLFYGACCVSNPIFCILFILYSVACILWTQKNFFVAKLIPTKTNTKKKQIKNKKKNVKKDSKKNNIMIQQLEKYNCFFDKKAFVFSFLGLSIIATISIVFFYITEGSVTSLLQNFGNLLQSSEYDIASFAIEAKFKRTVRAINSISFNMPYLLPVLFIFLICDKNRKNISHKIAYIGATIILSIVYSVGIFIDIDFKACIFSLPFFLVSLVSYILTEKRNKTLFYCMWCPCVFAAFIYFFVSDTLLTSTGIIFAISNIAGVFFVHDIFCEITAERKNNKYNPPKKLIITVKNLICFAIVFQIFVYIFALQFNQIPKSNSIKVSTGPYSGMLMETEKYSEYEKSIKDLNLIKERSNNNAPVLIVSFQNWMYLYVERPIATYTTWYTHPFNYEQLIEYYKQNKRKIPKYIYIVNTDVEETVLYLNVNNVEENISFLYEMFDFTQEELSNGVLLTVNECRINFN